MYGWPFPPQTPQYPPMSNVVYVPMPAYPPNNPGQTFAGPTNPVEKLTTKQIKKAIRFHESIVNELKKKDDKKDDKKKEEKKVPFLFIYTVLVASWPFIGLLGLQMLKVALPSFP